MAKRITTIGWVYAVKQLHIDDAGVEWVKVCCCWYCGMCVNVVVVCNVFVYACTVANVVQVSWCEMKKKEGRGARWTACRQKECVTYSGKKRKTTTRYTEIRGRNKKARCTWVKKSDLPLGLYL